MTAAPPNVRLLMADQLAASWLPFGGHPVVQAPVLGALARDGVVFEQAYCASPLCAPSRAALLTGRLPSRTGVYDNAAEPALKADEEKRVGKDVESGRELLWRIAERRTEPEP